jgi:hypothetical protein
VLIGSEAARTGTNMVMGTTTITITAKRLTAATLRIRT